ncbi:Hypothetical protein I595_3650 [Croceitalea dokdonensis DOKDO 023]|uniref:Uncharacterized protein n=1 Tax=Croceitalea dokdonensis DOKDO 023 TaxID=1300341 RepID=A0A0P7ACM4_9FLAO|nr:Hypothetical protein I595_3650 [Croceitalea dokdonensis DOKDO 023]
MKKCTIDVGLVARSTFLSVRGTQLNASSCKPELTAVKITSFYGEKTGLVVTEHVHSISHFIQLFYQQP